MRKIAMRDNGMKKQMTILKRVSDLALTVGLMASVALAVPFAHAESGSGGDNQYWKKKRERVEVIGNTTDEPVTLLPGTVSKRPTIKSRSSNTAAPMSNFVSNNAGKATTKTEIVAERGLKPMISNSSEIALADAISRYEIIVSRGGWGTVGNKKLAVDSTGAPVVALKRRLIAEGYLGADSQSSDAFTPAVEKAVARFQSNYGLAVTGKVDATTINAMNVSASQRLATLRANQPRMHEYAKDLGPRYVIVNTPALQLETVNFNTVFSRHNIIAGKIERATPVTLTKVSDINFNPYWNAPVSIVERDILPRLRREGNKVLRDMNMKIYDGYNGPEVDPRTVDWDSTPADRYFFRQEPGENNSMASVKINFPSPFGIYLHDTPTKYLFTTGARYVSSGCVRVEQVPVLVNWILNGQDGWNPSRIQNMAGNNERLDVQVHDGPQIRVVYLTAWVNGNGEANFRPDIYDLDDTGFVVGQPLAPGEYSDDGQRFVLKAQTYQTKAVASVDDDPFDMFQPVLPRRNGVKNSLWDAPSGKKAEPAPLGLTNFKSGLTARKKPSMGFQLTPKKTAAKPVGKLKKKINVKPVAAKAKTAAADPLKKKKKVAVTPASATKVSTSGEPLFGQQ
ncbi:hypothetical protein BH10PSE7_BH10PSE7_01530 [soil metagenome]